MVNKVKHTFEFDIPKQEALGCVYTWLGNKGRFRSDRDKKMPVSSDGSSDERSNAVDFDMSPYSFDNILNTPDREEIDKELSGKKTEVLVNTVVSHPDSMKDTILESLTGMLRLRERELLKSLTLCQSLRKSTTAESLTPPSRYEKESNQSSRLSIIKTMAN